MCHFARFSLLSSAISRRSLLKPDEIPSSTVQFTDVAPFTIETSIANVFINYKTPTQRSSAGRGKLSVLLNIRTRPKTAGQYEKGLVFEIYQSSFFSFFCRPRCKFISLAALSVFFCFVRDSLIWSFRQFTIKLFMKKPNNTECILLFKTNGRLYFTSRT